VWSLRVGEPWGPNRRRWRGRLIPSWRMRPHRSRRSSRQPGLLRAGGPIRSPRVEFSNEMVRMSKLPAWPASACRNRTHVADPTHP
jgi:hypothetical protein